MQVGLTTLRGASGRLFFYGPIALAPAHRAAEAKSHASGSGAVW